MITHITADNWMKAFKNGEQLGFSYLFDKYFSRLSFFGWKIIQNRADADEVAADSLQKAMSQCEKFAIEEDVRRFLYAIVKNRCFDIQRFKDRARHMRTDVITEEFDFTDNNNILIEIIRTEVVASIHTELELLPKQRKDILKLFFIDGLKIDEIAKKLHLQADNVRSSKAKGIKDLRILINQKKLLGFVTVLFSKLIFKNDG